MISEIGLLKRLKKRLKKVSKRVRIDSKVLVEINLLLLYIEMGLC
jgi:hypothetical protein